MKRVAGVPELLDGDLNDPSTLRRNLSDLRRLNRLSGGTALSRRAIAFLVPPPAPVSVLDIGTGAADIPLALLTDGRRRGQTVEVTATDSREEVLAAARALTPGLEQTPGLTLSIADGRALPFPDDAFDVAHASLVLHHIEPGEAVAFLHELARVSRRGIVVNDLSRRPITFIGAWLLSHVLTTNHYSRHDAPLSARRAYTVNEARSLMAQAGLEPVFISRGIVGHRWAIAAVRDRRS